MIETTNKYKSGCDALGRKEFVMMEKPLAEVIVENEITYQLAENGCYYPLLSLEQETDCVIGKYGIMRGEYMMKCQRHEYLKMLMDEWKILFRKKVYIHRSNCRWMTTNTKRITGKPG